MACSVLRCEKPATNGLALGDLGIGDPTIRHEVVVCGEHYYRLTDGERCGWLDEDRVLVVGEDLDSGGHLVPDGGYSIESTFGRTEVTIDVETPSGKTSDPVKFLVPPADRGKWSDFLRSVYPDTPPTDA